MRLCRFLIFAPLLTLKGDQLEILLSVYGKTDGKEIIHNFKNVAYLNLCMPSWYENGMKCMFTESITRKNKRATLL